MEKNIEQLKKFKYMRQSELKTYLNTTEPKERIKKFKEV